jgi:hypothetical protein
MTLSQAYLLAHDSEFRVLAGFASPPRAATVTALEPSGQVRLALDDADGADVLAWPLNGFVYGVGDVVYVLFAANSPDSGLVLGAKAPLPTLDAAVFAHDHAGYVARDGSTPLTGDWDIGDGRKLSGDRVAARDNAGLHIEDDGGNVGLFVKDGGDVAIGHAAPTAPFDLAKTADIAAGILAIYQGKRQGANLNVEYYHTGDYSTANEMNLALIANTNNGGANRKRTAASLNASFDAVADGSRNTLLRIGTAIAGTFGWALAITGKTLGLFHAAASPQGMLHGHNGVGGLICVTKSGVDGIAQTILPNATGDVTAGLAGLVVVSDGATASTGSVSLNPGGNVDIGAGTLTVRLACAADGSLTVRRQSGTGAATIVLLGVWI